MTTDVFSTVVIGEVHTRTGAVLSVVRGLSKSHVEQLCAYTLNEEDHALSVTSDRSRFQNLASYEAWLSQGRTIYGAIDAHEVLAGVVWCGPKPLPVDTPLAQAHEWHTMAYRSYEPYRGSGFMKNFCHAAFSDYRTFHSEIRLFVKISCGNEASIGLAQALGFTVCQEASSEKSVVLID